MLLNWRSLICEVKKNDRVISENLGKTVQIDKTGDYHSKKAIMNIYVLGLQKRQALKPPLFDPAE